MNVHVLMQQLYHVAVGLKKHYSYRCYTSVHTNYTILSNTVECKKNGYANSHAYIMHHKHTQPTPTAPTSSLIGGKARKWPCKENGSAQHSLSIITLSRKHKLTACLQIDMTPSGTTIYLVGYYYYTQPIHQSHTLTHIHMRDGHIKVYWKKPTTVHY